MTVAEVTTLNRDVLITFLFDMQVADVLCQMQLHDSQQLVCRLGELMLLQSRVLPSV